jgi:hypothetical protein
MSKFFDRLGCSTRVGALEQVLMTFASHTFSSKLVCLS